MPVASADILSPAYTRGMVLLHQAQDLAHNDRGCDHVLAGERSVMLVGGARALPRAPVEVDNNLVLVIPPLGLHRGGDNFFCDPDLGHITSYPVTFEVLSLVAI